MDFKENLFQNFVNEAGDLMTPSDKKVKKIIHKIRKKVKKYVDNNNLSSLVIGISGGLDSAVVAALCQEKYTGVPLIGLSIPISNSRSHMEMAKWVGEKYCSAFEEFNYWTEPDGFGAFNSVMSTVNAVDNIALKAGFNRECFDYKVSQANVKARLRMITLYDLARKTNGCVLSTDNYSELWTGFFTLHGDHNDLGVIQFIEKYWEEIPIAKALGIREDIIYQVPSDGLGVTERDTDEAQLGISYRELGPVIFAYENRFDKNLQNIFEEVKGIVRVRNVIRRHERMKFKMNWPHFITREDLKLKNKFTRS